MVLADAQPFRKPNRMFLKEILAEDRRRAQHYTIIRREGDFFIVDSSVINFTDQPFMIRKDFFLELLAYA